MQTSRWNLVAWMRDTFKHNERMLRAKLSKNLSNVNSFECVVLWYILQKLKQKIKNKNFFYINVLTKMLSIFKDTKWDLEVDPDDQSILVRFAKNSLRESSA